FVECDDEGVQAADRAHQAVYEGDLGPLVGEAAEEPVPDDENPAVVAVEVLAVRRVVYTVMGRRVEYQLQWPEAADEVGVQPELVSQVDCLHAGHRQRVEAEPVERQIEDPFVVQEPPTTE